MSKASAFKKIIVRAVNDHVQVNQLKQIEMSKKYGIPQPRLSNLICGRTDKFTLDAMIAIAEQIGVQLEMVVVSNSSGNTTGQINKTGV